jgi:lipoprotein-releasing system ATP-binding protein
MDKKRPILELCALTKTYQQGTHALSIFKNIDMTIHAGEIVGLVGVSGSGKSSLLHIAGLLDHPTSGHVVLEGIAIKQQEDKLLTKWRNEKIGFIYQFHHLLPEFTALENVMLPHLMLGQMAAKASRKARDHLVHLGLKDRLDHYPSALSGGEQQRVAIARALMNNPALILADEPTGNLDPGTAQKVFELFMSVVRERNIACLIGTHDLGMAKKMDRVLQLRDGSILEIS